MYRIYNRVRAYLFRLLDAKFGTETERMKYYCTFVSKYKVDSLLDIGCGKGLLFSNIESKNKPELLVGIDRIKTRNGRHQHIVADATRLPFKDKVFSLVTALSLVEHIPEDERRLCYEEVKRVAKKKGIFLIQLPNRYFIVESHTYLPFFGFLPSNMHSFAYRGEYVAVPSLKTVINALKKNQFKILNIEKYEAPFLPFGRFLSKISFFLLFPAGYIIHTQVRAIHNLAAMNAGVDTC